MSREIKCRSVVSKAGVLFTINCCNKRQYTNHYKAERDWQCPNATDADMTDNSEWWSGGVVGLGASEGRLRWLVTEGDYSRWWEYGYI